MKIGLLKETKRKNDPRVAITPPDARKLIDRFGQLQIKVQPSEIRSFSNQEYIDSGIEINNDLSDCDLLIGIKEVETETIIPDKKYLFYAHVAKEQSYHKDYFKQLAQKQITLLDYEYFTNETGKRITAFGYWAGIVGAYHSIVAIARRNKQLRLQPLPPNASHTQLLKQLSKTAIPPVKFIVTGTGLCAKGAIDTLLKAGISQVDLHDWANKQYTHPVFSQLSSKDYIERINGKAFSKAKYYQAPDIHQSIFNSIASKADVFIACHFWEEGFPNYLTSSELKQTNHQLKVIADISCDLRGPIASTLRSSTHKNPFYDYNPQTEQEEPPFSSEKNITIMAIDNLPASIARDASIDFSNSLTNKIIPYLIENDNTEVIKRATILQKGKLTSHFLYLYHFLNS